MSYTIDTNDDRLVAIGEEEKTELEKSDTMYDGMIADSDKFYQAQINASKQWADTQTKLQNEKTDFAIEQIEQQKDQAKKDYTKEQSGAYVDWQKQSNEYGANAEQMAAQGMAKTGYSESSQVSMYNTYQNRIATAREAFSRAVLNYDNAIKEARLQNNAILAEIAYEALQTQLELSLAGFQYKNTLLQQKATAERDIKKDYTTEYLSMLDVIYKEDALNADIEQQELNRKQQKEIADAQLAEEARQFNETMAWNREQANKSSSITKSSGGSSSGSSKKSSSGSSKTSSSSINKNGSTSKSSSSKKSSEPTVDMSSVLALGYGPISASRLNELVSSGMVIEYEKDGKLKYKKVFKR